MSDYIERQKAVEAIGEEYIPRTDFERGMVSQLSCDKEKINTLPSADVVKIVRCKNCKYHSYDEEFCCYWCEHAFMAGEVKPDFYCAYGEE